MFQLPGFVLAIKPIQDRLTCSSIGCNGQGDPDCPRHPLTCGCDWGLTCDEHRRASLHRHLADITAMEHTVSRKSQPAFESAVIQLLQEILEHETCMYAELNDQHSHLFWEDASQDALDPIAEQMDALHDDMEHHRAQLKRLLPWD